MSNTSNVGFRESEARKARRAMLEEYGDIRPSVREILPAPHRRKDLFLMPYPSEVFPTQYNTRLPEWRRRAGYSAYKEHWRNTREYVSVILGATVGFSSIVYFPMIASKYGHGAYIVVYTLLLFLIGFPLLFLQLALGQFTAKGTLRVFGLVPLAGGLGVTMMIYSTIRIVYENVKVAWVGMIFFGSFNISFTPEFYWYPTWKNCPINDRIKEHWVRCSHAPVTPNDSLSNIRCTHDYLHDNVLGLGDDCNVDTLDFVHESTSIHWELFGVLVFVYCIAYAISFTGIRSIGKYVVVMVPISFVMMMIFMIINIVNQTEDRAGAAMEGIKLFFTPKVEYFNSFEIWFIAALHVIHSMNLDTGSMIVIGSYARFQSSAQYHAFYVCVAVLAVSLVSGVVLYGEMGILAQVHGLPSAHSLRVPDTEFVPYFILFTLSSIDRMGKVSGMFVGIYFLILIALGTIHLIITMFVILKPIYERYPVLMKWNRLSNLAFLIPFLLLTIPWMTKSSRSMFVGIETWVFPPPGAIEYDAEGLPGSKTGRRFKMADIAWVTPFVQVPMVLVMLTASAFVYGYGLKRLRQDIDFMLQFYPNKFFAISWCSAPFLFLFLIVGALVESSRATKYKYQNYKNDAMLCALVSLLFLPVLIFAIWTCVRYNRLGLLSKIRLPMDEIEWTDQDLHGDGTLQREPGLDEEKNRAMRRNQATTSFHSRESLHRDPELVEIVPEPCFVIDAIDDVELESPYVQHPSRKSMKAPSSNLSTIYASSLLSDLSICPSSDSRFVKLSLKPVLRKP